MTDPTRYIIIWTNTNEPYTIAYITNQSVRMVDRCAPYQRILLNKNLNKPPPISFQSITGPKILAMYRNPNQGDFIIYEDGTVSNICQENQVGYLVKAGW
ncbi:MAG TPA: hypothetical protein VKR58_13040 [Aquella sp.]|nr:hypothetical protein [Aquella sp.]